MNWWTELSTNIKPYLEVSGLRIYYYGLIIGLGTLLALLLIQKRVKGYGLKRQDVEPIAWWVILPGLIGARIYHIIDNWVYYIVRPFDMVAVWNGGLAIYGGIIGGTLGLIYAARLKKIKLWSLLDLTAPSVALAQSIGRWGNFFNMEGFGPPTDLPWKIYISPGKRITPYLEESFFHPLFLYESLWNFSILLVLLLVSKTKPREGTIFGLYFLLYGLGRFFMEFGRLDTAIFSGFKVAQVLSLLFVIIGTAIILRRHLSLPLIKSINRS